MCNILYGDEWNSESVEFRTFHDDLDNSTVSAYVVKITLPNMCVCKWY